jgi:hypothetical protein
MADRELIAAVLTAGMLPTLGIPRSRVDGGRGRIPYAEARTVQCAIDHAVGLYRLVLDGFEADPFFTEETGRQPKAPAGATRNADQAGHSDGETVLRWKHREREAIDRT